jgi:hypothetical protein
MSRLTLAEIDAIRGQWQRAVLLYLTDRCPVECAHCSVSALRDRPRPDEALVGRLVDQLCDMPAIRMVGISGGEPFAERHLLHSAVGKLAGAGKELVLYTSGFWGRDDGTAAPWILDVLRLASCVVLSTDGYHAARVPGPRYVAALRAAMTAGCWIAVQVLESAEEVAAAERLLAEAFGAGWRDHAEIRATSFIARGRAARLDRGTRLDREAQSDQPPAGRPGRSFGRCPLAGAPVVRHDGRLTACCNEDVVSGRGPAALHRTAVHRTAVHPTAPHQAAAGEDLRQPLAGLGSDPFLRVMNAAGPGVLTLLPRYRELGSRSYPDICALCWTLLDRGAGLDQAVESLGIVLANGVLEAGH